ncbi:MAG: serine/threonine-protein kinase [Byssovorax sp.]
MSFMVEEGQIFAGKYRIEKVLGQGGMGSVLGAHHLGLDEPVAIKVLLPAMLEIPGMVDRFLREARAAAKIKNDHVVRVTDVDTLPSGVPFIVMERLEGVDLAALMKLKKRLGVDEAVRYLLEACAAIAEAHELGIIHRDLKPGNLFLAKKRDGSSIVKVLDFGISKLTGVLAQHQATTVGTVLGSPSYMSPEQMASAADVDGRTDIWALGAMLYQLTTGTLPFTGDTLPQICTKVLQAQPAKLTALRPELPERFEAVVLRCLEKDREARFASVRELMTALAPFAEKTAEPVAVVQEAAPVVSAAAEVRQAAPSMPEKTEVLVPTQKLAQSIVSSAVTVARPAADEKSSRGLLLAGAGVLALLVLGGVAVGLRSAEAPTSNAAPPPSTTTAPTAVETARPTPAAPPPPSAAPLASETAEPSAAKPPPPIPPPSASVPPPPTSTVKAPPVVQKQPPVAKPPPKPPSDDPFGGFQK